MRVAVVSYHGTYELSRHIRTASIGLSNGTERVARATEYASCATLHGAATSAHRIAARARRRCVLYRCSLWQERHGRGPWRARQADGAASNCILNPVVWCTIASIEIVYRFRAVLPLRRGRRLHRTCEGAASSRPARARGILLAGARARPRHGRYARGFAPPSGYTCRLAAATHAASRAADARRAGRQAWRSGSGCERASWTARQTQP